MADSTDFTKDDSVGGNEEIVLGDINDIANVKEENNPELQQLANDKDVVLLTFIGSYVPRRYGPTQFASSQMSIRDEFSIEQALKSIAQEYTNKPRKLYLLINSRGGSTSSAFKIAMAVRQSFDDITVFVPHMAASGGTILALTGNRIRMGLMSQLSPVDVQVWHKDGYMSANSLLVAETKLEERLAMKSMEELTYLDRHLTKSFDPAILVELADTVEMGARYLKTILEEAKYDTEKREKMAKKLIHELPTHGYVIHANLAKDMGIAVEAGDIDPPVWELMCRWFWHYISQEEDRHFVRYVIPKKK